MEPVKEFYLNDFGMQNLSKDDWLGEMKPLNLAFSESRQLYSDRDLESMQYLYDIMKGNGLLMAEIMSYWVVDDVDVCYVAPLFRIILKPSGLSNITEIGSIEYQAIETLGKHILGRSSFASASQTMGEAHF